MPTPAVMWFRRDLRRRDNPALAAAAADADVVPLVVLDPALLRDPARPRDAAFLAAVAALREELDGLVVRAGDPREVVPQVCREAGAVSVHVSAETTPGGRRRDSDVREALQAKGIDFVETGSPYAVGPGLVRTGGGTAYQVFTPFSRAWNDYGWRAPAEMPPGTRFARGLDSTDLPAPADLPPEAIVTETQARARWAAYRGDLLEGYAGRRDRADLDATSRLSTALKFGTIHPRTLLHDLPVGERSADRFRTELAWREFYADVLWHHPRSAWHDLRPALARLEYDDPSVDDEAAGRLRAWCEGRTGYPLVDAGMRQLLAEGWMHNRVRMVVASFLTKDLHLRWQHGARHFMDHLTDGDIASNSHGWQWVSGTGTDAAPYFRIFNPITQGKTADPGGDYVRHYVPELSHISGAAVHEPWRVAGGLSRGYPERIIDHAQERAEALRRYAEAREHS
ncbi:MAG: DNA photolyase family protein [Actinobacteria bacterium]|nr:DNA photolyase family protein [Actinomycetota bacterium]